MLGLLIALALGAAIGLARGGSFKQLERVHLAWLPVVFAAVGAQVLASIFNTRADGWISFGLVLAGFGMIFAFAFANRRHIGMPLVALGSFCNFLVILVNRGMPVSLSAAGKAGLPNPLAGAQGTLTKGAHRLLTDHTRLDFLADIIPLRVSRTVISVGDLLIWAGLILLLQHLMVGPRGRHHADARAPRQ